MFWKTPGSGFGRAACVAAMALAVLGSGCNADNPDDLAGFGEKRVFFYVNAPGVRPQTEQNRRPSEFLVELIDQADNTLEVCVYGFSKQNIIDAVVRAFYRGVKVRVVGDARHYGYGERGYRIMQQNAIPMQVGNQFSIMHNKFFVIDGRFTFVGTGNITTTGFLKNNNNWLLIDSQEVAADFQAEFDQMFGGRFSAAKIRQNNNNTYTVGDTTVEVYFSPQEDTMGRMLQELQKADTSVHFQIFAFTKDQVGSLFVSKHFEFDAQNAAAGKPSLTDATPTLDQLVDPSIKKVVGILDKSQFHGNGQFHEGYRLVANKVPVRIDANFNSYLPGDYQAGGGRLHTKTMILDYGTPNARVLTGSFNWSSSATISNDEVLLVLRGQRIAEEYMKAWKDLWRESLALPEGLCSINTRADELACGNDVSPGDVIISEVQWEGWNGLVDPSDRTGAAQFRDKVTNDEFVELYNTTNRPIDLSMWSIHSGEDVKMGFTPGTIIEPGQYFLILDHNTVPFAEATPQRGTHAFINPDFVLNMANDPRFPRLNIKNSQYRLELRSSTGDVIDASGDFGPPFAGGRYGNKVYSMERIIKDGKAAGPGDVTTSWQNCDLGLGGANVAPDFRDKVIATPGEANSK